MNINSHWLSILQEVKKRNLVYTANLAVKNLSDPLDTSIVTLNCENLLTL